MGLGLALEVAAYWKQQALSDIDVSLELAGGLEQAATTDGEVRDDIVMDHPNTCVLRKIPGHKIVLSSSPYLKAQVRQTLLSMLLPGHNGSWHFTTLPRV